MVWSASFFFFLLLSCHLCLRMPFPRLVGCMSGENDGSPRPHPGHALMPRPCHTHATPIPCPHAMPRPRPHAMPSYHATPLQGDGDKNEWHGSEDEERPYYIIGTSMLFMSRLKKQTKLMIAKIVDVCHLGLLQYCSRVITLNAFIALAYFVMKLIAINWQSHVGCFCLNA